MEKLPRNNLDLYTVNGSTIFRNSMGSNGKSHCCHAY